MDWHDAPLARLFPEAAPPGHNDDNGGLLVLILQALPADKLHTATAAGRAMACAGRALHPEECTRPITSYQDALTAGHVPALRWYWADQPGHLSDQVPVPYDGDRTVTAYLASRGHLAALRLARALGAPWTARAITQAARGGHLEVVQWAYEHGCPGANDLCASAAASGHLAVLQWARAQDPPCPWDAYTCMFAAMNGHLATLQWAYAHDCPQSAHICTYAAGYGHMAVLRWARANGHPWGVKTIAQAAKNGHLEAIQWARAQDPPCPWDSGSIAMATDPAVLQWLRENGCPEPP